MPLRGSRIRCSLLFSSNQNHLFCLTLMYTVERHCRQKVSVSAYWLDKAGSSPADGRHYLGSVSDVVIVNN